MIAFAAKKAKLGILNFVLMLFRERPLHVENVFDRNYTSL
jgi:hypothetical protein